MEKLLLVPLAIVMIGYVATWNKYYLPRAKDGKKTSFAGYIQWLKATYLKAPDDEWKD